MPAHFENSKNVTDGPPVHTKTANFLPADFGIGEGEVAFFSAKRWDRRNRADLIVSATPCHDAHMVGSYRVSSPLHLTMLAAMSEDYTTAPQLLHVFRNGRF